MAIIANTDTTYSSIGIREDLSNVIYNISPEETPFVSNAGKEKVSSTLYEWQNDALAAAAANAQLEGDDITSFTAVTPTVRYGNYVQISRKDVVISGTSEVVDKAGRKSELAYQLAKRGSELKRDMEFNLLSNQIAVAGNATTARKTAGLTASLRTNTNKGTGSAADPEESNGIVDVARVDGTTRAFTEVILKDVIKQVYDAGGSPTTLMVGSFNKQKVSAFAGIAGQRFNATGAAPSTIIGAADIYVSDFGNLSVVPNRFQRAREAFVIDWDYACVAELRPMAHEELSKTGDAEKRMILVEYGLKVKAEDALGIAADLTVA